MPSETLVEFSFVAVIPKSVVKGSVHVGVL